MALTQPDDNTQMEASGSVAEEISVRFVKDALKRRDRAPEIVLSCYVTIWKAMNGVELARQLGIEPEDLLREFAKYTSDAAQAFLNAKAAPLRRPTA